MQPRLLSKRDRRWRGKNGIKRNIRGRNRVLPRVVHAFSLFALSIFFLAGRTIGDHLLFLVNASSSSSSFLLLSRIWVKVSFLWRRSRGNDGVETNDRTWPRKFVSKGRSWHARALETLPLAFFLPDPSSLAFLRPSAPLPRATGKH